MIVEGEGIMMEPRTVQGRELLPLGVVAGRAIYRFTSNGEAYRLTPDTRASYLLRRESDGYSGVFDTLADAVAYVDTLEQQEM
jgi:hypothetical protein